MKLVCKLLFIVCLIGTVRVANAQSTTVPETFGQQVYPSSGSTRSRSNIMGGRAATAAKASDATPNPPRKNSSDQKQEQQEENEFEVGPYDQDGNYKYFNPED